MIYSKVFVVFSLLLTGLSFTVGLTPNQGPAKNPLEDYKRIVSQNYQFFDQGRQELEKIKVNAEEDEVQTYESFRKTMRRLKDLFINCRMLRRQVIKAKEALLKANLNIINLEELVDKDIDSLENHFDSYMEEFKVAYDEVKRSFHKGLNERKDVTWDKRLSI
ncbi:hypothetical protein K7432_005329 [Basidiobolus ranarum]|uniref:Uncharacterized protein n=1 Tax=Basidiobolus ranarum TaxID=34480 RepID=A0ABR2WWR5_9FUNG